MPKKIPSPQKTAPKSASNKAAARVTMKTAAKKTAAKTARTTSSKIPAVKAAKAAAPIGKAALVAETTAPAEALVASAHSSADGLKVTAYRGDGSVLLAFNFDAQPEPGFAGFAVQCTAPDGSKFFLKNRLTFDTPVTNKTTPAQRHAMPND